jgi:hypothetical protein
MTCPHFHSLCLSLSLSFFPVAPTLEHRASVKHFVSLQLFNPKMVGLLGWGISLSQGRYLHGINADIHLCLEWDSSPQSQRLSKRRQFMP